MSDINDAMEKNVDDKMLKQIFFNCAKETTRITDKDMNELKQLFDGDHKITHLKTFLSTKKKQFATIIKQNTTKINTAVSSELYRKIEKRLLQVLQQKQFLDDLDMNIIIEDYHHILNTHIEGNETTQQNVFRFFAEAMHFTDSPTEHCQALHRRKQRLHHLQESKEQKTQDTQEQKEHNSDNISIWSLELYLKLSQLDIIHYHLAHSKEKRLVKLYANEENNEETLRNLKFVTELTDKDIHTYKFGIDYSYSDTCGQYYCIKEEMLFNTLHPLPFQTFQILMAKCITKHRVALKLHRNRLFCKYYKKQYNIIRNEPIGIRHVFAIVVYTDITEFCTQFRTSFRRINDEQTEDEAKSRHNQFYNYARALFEAVEFFGTRMDDNIKVYHGLNRVLFFSHFTAYFEQPISTTKSMESGIQFSEGNGIVLKVKSGWSSSNEKSKSPKYLAVSWLSDFPYEEEQLFYGENVVFEIVDILKIVNGKWQKHSVDLKALNTFQKMVHNKEIEWHHLKKQHLNKLIQFIKTQQHDNTTDAKETDEKEDTQYGQQLFRYFCNNIMTSEIGIKHYYLLPDDIQNALHIKEPMKLIPIVSMFENLTELSFSNLDFNEMREQRNYYADAVLSLLKRMETSKEFGMHLQSITFKSKWDNKEGVALQETVNDYKKKLLQYRWEIRYKFNKLDNKHNLTFINTTPMMQNRSCSQFKHSYRLTDKKPSYFMQIISISEKTFHVVLIADSTQNVDKKLRIYDNMNHRNVGCVTMEAKKQQAGIDINIEEKDSEYRLAVYDASNMYSTNTDALFKTTLVLMQHPPPNPSYKPKPIDLTTMFQVKDDKNKTVHIYWSTPQQSYGIITYEIDDKKEDINILPYTVPLNVLPKSFTVITVSTVGDERYESEPSKPIYIPYLCPPIGGWEEYRNLLQILGVHEDTIKIKFTLKKAVNKRTKYTIQSVDTNGRKSSRNLVFTKGDKSKGTEIDVIANMTYDLSVLLDKKQISNEVHVKTETYFDPNETNYLPSSPSLKSIKQYYDENKENILVTWDHPNDAFGDQFRYKITSKSSQQESEEINELPYKLSIESQITEITIATICVFDKEPFEGKESDVICIGI